MTVSVNIIIAFSGYTMSTNSKSAILELLKTIFNVAIGIGAIAVICSVMGLGTFLFAAVVGGLVVIALMAIVAVCLSICADASRCIESKEYRDNRGSQIF